ncbi:MAG: DUF1127 domain-containing protein [Pseudorhodobacter sp.]
MTYENFETLTAHRPLPPLAAVAFALAVTILKWEQRRQSRRALKRLNSYMLKDIGLTREDADLECDKPFWRG